jgi:hypothetical protein
MTITTSKWYYRVGRRTVGSFSPETMRQMAARGILLPTHSVRRGIDGAWVPATRVKGLLFRPITSDHQVGQRWYLKVGETVRGPFSPAEIVRGAHIGHVQAGYLLRLEGQTKWVRAGAVRGIQFGKQVKGYDTAPIPLIESLLEPRSKPPICLQFTELGRLPCFSRTAISTALVLLLSIIPFVLPGFGATPNPIAIIGTGAATLLAAFSAYYLLLRPDRTAFRWGIAAFCFVSIFGSTTLLQFTELAVSLEQMEMSWQNTPLWLVKGIGRAYLVGVDEQQIDSHWTTFAHGLIGTIASAGFLEESLKLLPVMFAGGIGSLRNRADIIFLGAAAGIGLGIAEGLWIAFTVYVPDQAPLSTFLMRFMGGPMGHAAMSTLAASLLAFFILRDESVKPFWQWALFAALSAIIIAVPHALYDTFVANEMTGAAGITMVSLVWMAILQSGKSTSSVGA